MPGPDRARAPRLEPREPVMSRADVQQDAVIVPGPGLLVDVRRAARHTGVSERHFRALVARGFAPRPVHLGRCVRWRVQELHAWVAAGCPSRERWEAMENKAGGV